MPVRARYPRRDGRKPWEAGCEGWCCRTGGFPRRYGSARPSRGAAHPPNPASDQAGSVFTLVPQFAVESLVPPQVNVAAKVLGEQVWLIFSVAKKNVDPVASAVE